jgi:hypothetical protein
VVFFQFIKSEEKLSRIIKVTRIKDYHLTNM